MDSIESRYSFSFVVLLEPMFWLITLAIILFTSINFNLIYIVFLIPVIIFILLFLLPNSILKAYYYLINQPAVIINSGGVVDNINHCKLKWSDIHQIGYNENKRAIEISIGEKNLSKHIRNSNLLTRVWLKVSTYGSEGTLYISRQGAEQKLLLEELVQIQTPKWKVEK